MKVDQRHGPTVFLIVMVFFMVLAMTIVLSIVNGALQHGFWRIWGRNFVIAYPVALPVAYVSRILANRVVARLTGPSQG
jgi:hypothetical protein